MYICMLFVFLLKNKTAIPLREARSSIRGDDSRSHAFSTSETCRTLPSLRAGERRLSMRGEPRARQPEKSVSR